MKKKYGMKLCKGFGCPVRFGCRRFLDHVEAEKKKQKAVYETEMFEHGECVNRIEVECRK